MQIIQYIGKRAYHSDSLYGTGDWVNGQKKEVSETTASKMLKHPDVYSESAVLQESNSQEDGRKLFSMAAWPGVKQIEVVHDQPKKNDIDDNGDQAARDAVNAMDSKEAIADYARVNFNQMIPKTLSVENMKQRALTMIDQYGAQ